MTSSTSSTTPPTTTSGDDTASVTAETTSPLLDVNGLSVELRRGSGSLRLVEDISFRLDPGTTLGLVGESGSGKSVTAMSLLRLLPQQLHIATGSVHFAGRDLLALTEPQLRTVRGRDAGVVFQDPQNSLNPAYTVGNQLVETIRAHTGLSRKEATARAVELLDRVGIHRAAARMSDYPHQLSGGMAQRAMIAMAIALDPKLLIADEPTTALDVTVQTQILGLLRSLQDQTGMGLLIISHDLSVIAEMADQVAVMYGGQMVEHGDVVPTLTTPTHPYTEALLSAQPAATVRGQPMATIAGIVPNADAMPAGCRFNPRCTYAVDACRTSPPLFEPVPPGTTRTRCLRHDELELSGVDAIATGRSPSTSTPPAETSEEMSASPVLVDVDGLQKTYALRTGRLGRKRPFDAASDVSFALHQGETVGLVGESGAGKSTVGRMVLGLTPPSAGTVRFDGADVRAQPRADRRITRREIQAIFQNPYSSLDPTMTIGESVAEPLDVHRRGTRPERVARVTELLGQVGLDPSIAARRPHELSGGQRQRAAIARSLALNPRLIVCDEPVSALDVSTQAQVVNLLRELQQRFGIAYLFVGHDLSVVYQISDRIAVMYAGRIVEMGPAPEVYHAPRHPYTSSLLDAVLSIDPRSRRLPATVADVPEAVEATAGSDSDSAGCAYAQRCPHVTERCRTVDPPPVEVDGDVVVRCHHPITGQHQVLS